MVRLLHLLIVVVAANAEDKFLKCDELERQSYLDIYCTVSDLIITHSQQVKVESYPSSQSKAIAYMKFYDSSLLFIPHKIFEYFQNLKNLDVAYSEVIEITRNTFASADNLLYLNASHNKITEINTSVFVGANHLARIDLSNNQIATLNENAFKGLGMLDRLWLSHNKIKVLDKSLFIENLNLDSIALDNNEIEVIEPELFSELARIRDIDLTNNRIMQINPRTFATAYVEALMLSGNRLTEFHLDTRTPISTLYIDNNRLSSLVINATKFLKADNNNISSITALSPLSIERLFISNNSIVDIQNLMNLTSLIVLDISYNHIGNVNISTFSKLTRLKTLKLRGTNITGMDFGTFSKQTSLEVLDISCNNLQYINLDTFVPYLSKLQELYVDGNNLTEIRGKLSFSYAFPVLSTIGLSNNNFNCSYLHHIMTPPYFSNFVKLHLDVDTSSTGMPHIRGIACRSDEYMKSEKSDVSDVKNRSKELLDSESAIQKMKIYEEHLMQQLILLKIFIGIVCVLAGSYIIYKMVKLATQNRSSLVRSIAYRSTATVSTMHTMDP